RRLVTRYGMSTLGPIVYGDSDEMVFLGKELAEKRNYSEEVASKIDKEISKFIKKAQATAKQTLTQNKKKVEKLAKHLMENETIERKEFDKLMAAA
ncbi:MAG: cell division protein FtsH, partial [Candidatus Spechtbacterales bacterium]|nr:cell division protein FtsH [Candidatus Spechtbacterales bacterium]